jgi:carboxyl-terminal processing protease
MTFDPPNPAPAGDPDGTDRPEVPPAPVDPGSGALVAGAPPTGVPGALPTGVQERRPSSGLLLIAVAIVAILAGSALFVSGFSLGRHAALTPGTPTSEAEDFQAFWDAYRAITDRYAGGEVDRKTLIEGAIKGMFEAIGDPYSSYLTSEEYRNSLRGISGEFEGIGAEIGTVDASGTRSGCSTLGPECFLTIVSPLDGSPAQKAGLLAGDLVLAADGTPLDGLTIDEARDRIRGPRDTTVRLTIRRGDETFDVDIVRAVIVQREVIAEDLANGTVGYVRLIGFSDHAAQQLDAAIADDVKAGKTKLILDLRGNPGGFVTAAREVASQFLASGTIFWQEDAQGGLTETTAEPGGAATDPAIRLIVLVDRGSASASEIVAGALQDRGRATLVGEQTFGKGTVQQWTQLEDDHGGFRLTVAKWLTPNKTWIHGTGITPDVVVTQTPSSPDDDPALDKALELLDASTSMLERAAA